MTMLQSHPAKNDLATTLKNRLKIVTLLQTHHNIWLNVNDNVNAQYFHKCLKISD
jgi:hypothetical protein